MVDARQASGDWTTRGLMARAALLFCCLSGAAHSAAIQSSAGTTFADLSQEAAAARDGGDLERAGGLYEQALKLQSDWREGWWSLGTIRYDQNRYAEAARAFARLSEVDTKAGSARVMLGLSEFELGRDAEALRHIQEGERIGVVDNQQLRQVALYHEGLLEQRAGKFEAAERVLDSLCIAGVESDGLLAALGMTALRLTDRDAERSEAVTRVGRAECLAAQKKFADGRNEYEAALKAQPDFPKLHYAFGRFLLNAHDAEGGMRELEQEIRQQPHDSLARLQIAAEKYKVDSAAGIPYARAAVRNNPAAPFGHYLLGLLLLDTGDDRGAILELEEARRGMRDVPNVYAALGSAYAQAGREKEAAEARQTLQRLSREAAAQP